MTVNGVQGQVSTRAARQEVMIAELACGYVNSGGTPISLQLWEQGDRILGIRIVLFEGGQASDEVYLRAVKPLPIEKG